MDKMVSLNDGSINRQPGDLNNQGIIDPLKSYEFHFIPIFGNYNQCLQYWLNAFYHDIDEIKNVTIFWSAVHWVQYPTYRTNDNVFVFNQMIGYNTALCDDVDNNGNVIV